MTISRRKALGGAASILAAVPIANSAAPRAPTKEDFGALPSKQEIWDQMLFLVNCGSRNTAFPGHVKFVNYMAQKLGECPGVKVSREGYSFDQWVSTNYTLSLQTGNQRRDLHATSVYPYSGKTGPKGVTAQLINLGRTTPNEVGGSNPIKMDESVRGKIVLLTSPVHGFPFGTNFKVWGSYEKDVMLPDRIQEAIYQNRSAPPLDQFKQAGAVGVIMAWEGVTDENAEGQYAPFGRKYADIPCLWVGEKTGAELRQAAAQGGRATMVLEAKINPNTPTETISGFLQGASDETILVHTHSDGPNAVEENAPIGVVALAKYLSNLPKGTLKRSYLFTMTAGHMAYAPVPKSWEAFKENHPDLIKRIVGALVFEHLGSRSWIDRDGAYVPSGQNQTTMIITQSGTLADLALKSCVGTIDDRMVAVNPVAHRYTGESGGVIEAGIPTIGIMPAPSYLLKESSNCGIERMDPRLYRAQLENFTRMLRRMDGMSREQLAGAKPLGL